MSEQTTSDNMVRIIYVLYLVALIVPITSLVGVILAYVNQGEAQSPESAHYRFQIRTFWIGLLYSLVGIITTPIGVGAVILLVTLVWWIVRCAKGLTTINNGQEPADVEGWLF